MIVTMKEIFSGTDRDLNFSVGKTALVRETEVAAICDARGGAGSVIVLANGQRLHVQEPIEHINRMLAEAGT